MSGLKTEVFFLKRDKKGQYILKVDQVRPIDSDVNLGHCIPDNFYDALESEIVLMRGPSGALQVVKDRYAGYAVQEGIEAGRERFADALQRRAYGKAMADSISDETYEELLRAADLIRRGELP